MKPFCFVLPVSKSSLVCIIFRTPMQSSWSRHPHMRCTWTRLQSSMPPMQLTQHIHWGNTCVLITLRNRSTSDYFSTSTVRLSQHATHAIHAAFPLGHLRPVSCYAAHAIYMACEKGSSGQFSAYKHEKKFFLNKIKRNCYIIFNFKYSVNKFIAKYHNLRWGSQTHGLRIACVLRTTFLWHLAEQFPWLIFS